MSPRKAKKKPPVYPRDYIPRRASIVGMARSGIAAAQFLAAKGTDVFLSDSGDPAKVEFALASNGLAHLPHETGENTDRVLDADVVVLSPGVPSDIPVLKKARERGVPVWSELELAFRMSKATYCAVTGSTGKSTTVSLVGAIMAAAGVGHVVAGNIGLPLTRVATVLDENAFVAAEISSFQLENIDLFRPRVAAVLNLMKNHLDRYESEQEYYDAKKAIARNMGEGDTLVLNAEDPLLCQWAGQIGGALRVVYFGAPVEGYDAVWADGGELKCSTAGQIEVLAELERMKIKGRHNHCNAAAAAAVTVAAGLPRGAVAEGLYSFAGLPHRLEFVRTVDGVGYYNDSKATTAESIVCAVGAFEANVHLIAGGRDKGCDFDAARPAVEAHVKTACLIGEAAARIQRRWKGATRIERAETLEQAIDTLRSHAEEGDVVVLSPGCSSFDMFAGYEDRGERFRHYVQQMQAAASDD